MSLLDVKYNRHSAAYSLESSTTPWLSRLIMTRTMPSSDNTCRTSGNAERFLSVPATMDDE
jgi:hypothetical protein